MPCRGKVQRSARRPCSDPSPAGLVQAVDAEDDQAERHEDQQEFAERLVPQREQRLVDAAGLGRLVCDGRFLPGPARRLGLRAADVDKTIRVQNGDDIKEVATGVMEPNGQLVLTLKEAEQSATKGDIAGLTAQLKEMQASLELLSTSR